MINLKADIVINKNSIDEEIAKLNREATVNKGIDWSIAISNLQEAKALMLKRSPCSWPFKQWLRLPLFLQQANRFDEALVEFDWLLNSFINTYIECASRQLKRKDIHFKEYWLHLYRYYIYDKICLSYKREGLKNEAVKFREKAKQEEKLSDDVSVRYKIFE